MATATRTSKGISTGSVARVSPAGSFRPEGLLCCDRAAGRTHGRGVCTTLLSEQVYGGTSGNYLLVLLEIGGVELSPNDRQTTVTFGELTDDQATVRLSAVFEEGVVEGPLDVPVIADGENG